MTNGAENIGKQVVKKPAKGLSVLGDDEGSVRTSFTLGRNSNSQAEGAFVSNSFDNKNTALGLNDLTGSSQSSKASTKTSYSSSMPAHSKAPLAGESSAIKGVNGADSALNQTSAAIAPTRAAVSNREIKIDVPEGAKVPVLFQDNESKPPQQMRVLDQIAAEFEQNVSEIPPQMTKEEVWEAARLIADERYLILYGYQAFNEYHLQAAKEALKEKKANPSSTR